MEKITLITGSASGLGKEFAKLFAKDHNNLLLVDKNQEGLNQTKKEIEELKLDIHVDTFLLDLAKVDTYHTLLDYTKEKEYFVNNLVNAAGFGDRCDFKDMNIDKQIALTNVNCNAVLYNTRVFLDDMLKNNEGHIINISSIAGFTPGPFMCTYHASKGYVLLLGESISRELKGTNVKLLTLCPGPFNSNFVKEAHNDYTFSKIKPWSSYKVAEYGYKKSKKGKVVAITGFKNKVTVFITRFFSRNMVRNVAAKTMKPNV